MHFKKVNRKFSKKGEKELLGYELCPLDNPCYALNSRRPFWSCFYGHSPPSILFHTELKVHPEQEFHFNLPASSQNQVNQVAAKYINMQLSASRCNQVKQGASNQNSFDIFI